MRTAADFIEGIPPGDSQTDIEDALGVMGGGEPLIVPPRDDAPGEPPEVMAVTDTLIVHYRDGDGHEHTQRLDVRGHRYVSVNLSTPGEIDVYGHDGGDSGSTHPLDFIETRELTPGALVKSVWLAKAIIARADELLGPDVVERLRERDMPEEEMADMLRWAGL